MGGIGVAAMVKAKGRTQRIVACMPLLFAVQQVTEGLLWLSLMSPHHALLKKPAMYAFLVFAEMVWPVYMPLIALLAEQRAARKKALRACVALGALMVLQLVYGMTAWPTDARLQGGHILYDLQYPPANTLLYGLLYGLTTIAGPMLSSNRLFRLLGISLAVSYAFSRVYYNHYIISIWCYFAAFISVIALAMIFQLERARQEAGGSNADLATA